MFAFYQEHHQNMLSWGKMSQRNLVLIHSSIFFQAQARCHRIGQVRMVKVYRLITRNSYEREMFDRASMKLGLDKAVLQSMGGEKINPVSLLYYYCLQEPLWSAVAQLVE